MSPNAGRLQPIPTLRQVRAKEVQHAVDHATALSLVSCRLGVAFVSETARWQCPRGIKLLPIADLDIPVPIYLIWRKDNPLALLQNFVAQVKASV